MSRAASSLPGAPHSCGSGTGIVRICRLKPAFRHRIAWGGELDAALPDAQGCIKLAIGSGLSRRDTMKIAPDLLIPWKMAEPIPDTTNEVYTP